MVCEYSGKSDGPANSHYESDKYSGTPETSGIISDQGGVNTTIGQMDTGSAQVDPQGAQVDTTGSQKQPDGP